MKKRINFFSLLFTLKILFLPSTSISSKVQLSNLQKQPQNKKQTPQNLSAPTNSQILLNFSNYIWTVHPNNSVASSSNAFVDSNGYLHMKITKQNGNWLVSSIYLTKPLGYGTYIFTIDKNYNNIDPKAVIGTFVWQNNTQQIDIQISQWGNPSALNTQYALQPSSQQGNNYRFSPQKDKNVVHCFTWNPNKILFQSFYADSLYYIGYQIGRVSYFSNVIRQWTYLFQETPVADNQRVFINFYLSGDKKPLYGKQQEIIIREFKFWKLQQINLIISFVLMFLIICLI